MPNAVPAAGGCSTSNTTIKSMVMPTDKENHIALKITMCINGKTAKQEPIKKPRKCPPIILFGSAAILFGIAKTINAVAPILATMTGLSYNMRVMMKTVKAAKEL
tara:strand:- start:3036 stop:3350 length:315 start_codon:yes stop_codon:yes gene_type:complete